ncbi:unnamed protein product, partial [Ectocarpus fasciculatus]
MLCGFTPPPPSSDLPAGPPAPTTPVGSTATAPPPRRLGRPRRTPTPSTPTPTICPTTGDIIDDILDSGLGTPCDFSVTIGRRNGVNVSTAIFDDAASWMKKRAVRGVTSLERGEHSGNLHLQGIWTLGMKKSFGDDKKEQAALRKKLRLDCSWSAEDQVKITIKRLVKQQTFSGTRPLLFADEGRSHFRTATKGVSRTEVNIALAEYRTLQRTLVSER